MKKSIQEEIEALRAETAAANAATAAYNREKETYRRQADETAVELAKMRAELMRAERDVLTRIMFGEQVDDTFLPCGYVPRYKEGQDAA